MKRFLVIAAVLLCACMLFAQPAAEKKAEPEQAQQKVEQEKAVVPAEPVTIHLGVPTAPPALPVLRMIEANMLGDNVKIELDVWNAPEQLIAMVQDKNHDMFAFPLTVVAKLYNKGLNVRLMNVNTWGVTYFLTTDPNFKTWGDLNGKTIYVPLQTSPPDALTQFFLNEAGLKVGQDVQIVYATTPEVTQLLASGKAVYATQIEPQCTAAMKKNSAVRRALSFQDEWQRVTKTDTMIPNAGFGTTQDFIDKNPELVAAFNAAYKEALAWVLENPAETGKLAEKYLGMNPGIVTASIPNMGLCFRTGVEADAELEMFWNLLNNFNKTMIGGKTPDDGIYYK